MTQITDQRIFVHGSGAVSPAGWSASALSAALATGQPCPVTSLEGGAGRRFEVRRVPPRNVRLPALQHPRLRRSSSVSQFAVCAAFDALGQSAFPITDAGERLGIVCSVMGGGVSYSRRFYAEVLSNPTTASPLLFPETVFNAPAAHLGALLGATGPNYTVVSDQTGFLDGLALAADWLTSDLVDGCLVVGTEEADWLTARALSLFTAEISPAEGSGALYLRRDPSSVELSMLTDPVLYRRSRSRTEVIRAMYDRIPTDQPNALLVDSTGTERQMSKKRSPWLDWSGRYVSPQRILGEGFGAGGAWSCVTAVRAIAGGGVSTAWVPVAGSNLQAMAAGFAAVVSDPVS